VRHPGHQHAAEPQERGAVSRSVAIVSVAIVSVAIVSVAIVSCPGGHVGNAVGLAIEVHGDVVHRPILRESIIHRAVADHHARGQVQVHQGCCGLDVVGTNAGGGDVIGWCWKRVDAHVPIVGRAAKRPGRS
jgi:hypothetical protein